MDTREQVLSELDLLATIEHALIVEYLWVQCILGHDVPPPDGTIIDPRVGAAAQVAFDSSLRSMRRLRRINETLARAGRPCAMGRASSLDAGGTEIMFGRLAPDQLERLADRESAIARAVDARYERLRPVVDPAASVLDGDLLSSVEFIVATGVDHIEALHDFHANLADVPPDQYLRVTRHQPTSGAEESLRAVADRQYGLIVAAVTAEFSYGDDFGGRLLQHAVSIMEGINDLHRLLVARGLLPAFALPA